VWSNSQEIFRNEACASTRVLDRYDLGALNVQVKSHKVVQVEADEVEMTPAFRIDADPSCRLRIVAILHENNVVRERYRESMRTYRK
jgi:hypothetical protein